MGKREAATIKDVANLAGVSIATVSRVLNNLGVVNPETERKVLSAVNMLHYQRNAVARSLKLRVTKSIGIIVPEISNTFFTEIVEQLEKLLGPLGYALLLCSSENSVHEEKRKLAFLLERNVDALLVIPVSDVGAHFTSPAISNTPLVMLDRKIEGLCCDVVLTDNRKGAYDVTCALIREGKTNIGFLGGDNHVHTSVERLHGFLDAMHAHQKEIDPNFILLGGMTQKSGYTLMQKALTMPKCPDTFFVVNDMVHIGATSYLMSQASREVRSNMVFSTFDYLYYAPLLKFCHYAVAQPLVQMGETAAQLLIRRLDGDLEGFPATVVIEPTICVLEDNGGVVTDEKSKVAFNEHSPQFNRVFS
ncbi:MAG: LacI family transcriptional regulator [Sphaerochaeta sp.]|jgi:LacI family transcriptional regulator|nr:LacI family DNA-binding transcriptional regulator [Spirochaetaceae bacterium]MDK2859362.1 LacI family transcriptional regulator [Sphaerochaeta sp.]